MADRIEREINEILAKLEDLPDGGVKPERKPVSIADARERRRVTASSHPATAKARPSLARLNPAKLLVAGAGAVIGGFVLSIVWAPLIWAAFAGVVVFVGGFVGAIVRPAKSSSARNEAGPGGHYWRDRYIAYEPTTPGAWARFKRRFRR